MTGLLAGLLLAMFAIAATPDQTESWSTGDTEGWIRQDPLNSTTVPLNNPANYLEVVFNSQSRSFPQVHIVQAHANASGGAFTADYWDAGITNITFKLYCKSHRPAQLRLYFYNSTSKNWWYYSLGSPRVGAWTTYTVPLNHAAGWRTGLGGTSAEFKADLKEVEWVGIQIQRHGSRAKQTYGLDNFVLRGASRSIDSDGDGMTDWSEFIAGTDPHDPNSSLQCFISITNGNLIVLRWRSVGNRVYGIDRSGDLVGGPFGLLTNGIDATPPINEYVDQQSTNRGPYYYRINVEE